MWLLVFSRCGRNYPERSRLQVADEFLDKVGLSEFRNKYPSQLSGGMQQRAAIARALAMDTEILLMDEPFSALDAKNRIALQELLLKLWEGENSENKKTVVFVTHDIDEAIFLSDKIVVLTSHPGTVYDIVEVPFERPRNREELIERKDMLHSAASCCLCSTTILLTESAEMRLYYDDKSKIFKNNAYFFRNSYAHTAFAR